MQHVNTSLNMNKFATILVLQALTLIPNFSETAFSPLLIHLQQSWHLRVELAELPFSIYLAGMATGLLYWGLLADRKKHKPLLAKGLTLYCISCLLCWLSPNIYFFTLARFSQGLFAVIASVMTLVIIRKLFNQTNERAKIHSYIGMSLSVSPALGPLFGMHFADSNNWQNMFAVLALIVALVALAAHLRLPETGENTENKFSISVAREIIQDRQLIFYATIAGLAIANAMVFFALSPYYYEVIYHLSTSQFSLLFICIAASWVAGSLYAQMLIKRFGTTNTIHIGCYGAILFSCIGVLFTYYERVLGIFIVPASIATICLTMVHTGTIIPNCISMALANRNSHVGTASSIMGFTYNFVAAIITSLACLGPQSNPHYFHAIFLIINLSTLMMLTYCTSTSRNALKYEKAQ